MAQVLFPLGGNHNLHNIASSDSLGFKTKNPTDRITKYNFSSIISQFLLSSFKIVQLSLNETLFGTNVFQTLLWAAPEPIDFVISVLCSASITELISYVH